jgi:alpha-D-ribose 1-methylphosphonate 5-triphosphate synthase subunit PhnH
MTVPPYTPAEARSRETFLALMWALSYPGRIHQLPDSGTSFDLIAETLLDLETSYYTPDPNLESKLAQSGARALPLDSAAYQFYPVMGESELATVRSASVGTVLYPDEAATLIIGCTLNQGTQLKLTGPGVKDQQPLSIAGLPEGFWRLRESACRFPLGWDIYFVDGQQVVGLPRSVQVELM